MEDGRGVYEERLREIAQKALRLFDFTCSVAFETACPNQGAVRLQRAAQLRLW